LLRIIGNCSSGKYTNIAMQVHGFTDNMRRGLKRTNSCLV